MHPFVHSFNPAIAPPWQTRTDWDAFQTIAKFSELAAGHLDTRKDVVAVPLLHDTPDAMANPHGVVKDWKHGECEPVQASPCPSSSRSSATTPRSVPRCRPSARCWTSSAKGITYDVTASIDYLAQERCGAWRPGRRATLVEAGHQRRRGDPRSPATNGHLATQGFKTWRRTGTGSTTSRPSTRASRSPSPTRRPRRCR